MTTVKIRRKGTINIPAKLRKEYKMEKYSGRVFLKPTRSIMEMYIPHQTDPIIVIPLISQSPGTSHKGIPFPKLEKILVDTFADDNIFYAFQGEERLWCMKGWTKGSVSV
jgi:bifunctional DNA-binding transcriptional regulator/antitoxin component of YhaV-PrlF toxin-antitoxin module